MVIFTTHTHTNLPATKNPKKNRVSSIVSSQDHSAYLVVISLGVVLIHDSLQEDNVSESLNFLNLLCMVLNFRVY